MEAINKSITEMSTLFSKKMAEFEADLKKAPSTASTTSVASEFSSFRIFIVQALGSLQQQVELLAQSMDSMEMRGRRKILLLHGVPEVKEEVPSQVVANFVVEHLKVGFKTADIKRCHRMGRNSLLKPRPILVKFHDVTLRDQIWFSKSKLKGSAITVSEFLTRTRHCIFMAARERFGVSQCWTREGIVYVLGPDGKRNRVTSLVQLDKIEQQLEQVQPDHTSAQSSIAVTRAAATKSKRVAAKK